MALDTSEYLPSPARRRQRQHRAYDEANDSRPRIRGVGRAGVTWAASSLAVRSRLVFLPNSACHSLLRRCAVPLTGSLLLLAANGVTVSAAGKSTKTTTPTKASGKTATAAAKVPVSGKATAKVTLPAPVTPGKDLTGWESLTDAEWPKSLDAVRAKAINSSIRVHRAPDDFAPALQMTSGKSAFGDIAFLALGKRDEWVRVLLPLRPNGSVGWVRASDVTLDRMLYRVVIEVNTNTLSVEGPGGNIVTTKVALGTNNTPTPTGLFYVREIVPQANPNGGLGPVALGLSGLSEELHSFSGGFGRVAIHGTNAPGKIGTDVSHGCVRMDNVNITRLAKLLPLGTPVEIVSTRSDLVSDSARKTSDWIAVARPLGLEPISSLTEPGASTTSPATSTTPTRSVSTSTVVQVGVTVPPVSTTAPAASTTTAPAA